ncbi:hypothetical protein H6F44_20645 [Pseudanabaena sp. FACHB-1277]|uniref:Uncharacterized protein n=1 Tax=Pseudanabaena cinerea FACHB-1277 TaxID=2949581 RepID=A0A926UWI4_9CYAN|nr:hypothetical protein [Pseudanabaena cinerea]MBD2152507.1 hypothetical protein [Pseudanabaena cinerea FACHB-1277]
MVDTKAVSVRLPLDLLNELNSYATDKGMVRGGEANIGGAIISILREHFGKSDNVVKQKSDSIDIDAMVATAIKKQLADIDKLITTAINEQLTDIKERILEEHGAGVRGISMGYESLLDDVRKDINDLTVSLSKDMIAIDERLEALEATVSAKKPLLSVMREKVLAA